MQQIAHHIEAGTVLDHVLSDYLAGQLTEGTRRIYNCDIRQVFGGVPTWEDVTSLRPEAVVMWRNEAWNGGKGLAATTINRKLTALKTFYDHLIARGMLQFNPCNPKLVRRIKEKKAPGARLGISKEELEALLAACHIGKNQRANVRDYTIISLMYTCLLRRSEVAAFRWKDLERDGGRSLIVLPLTKGGANDFVPVEQPVLDQLNHYYMEMGGASTWLAHFGRPIEECPVFLALDNGHRGDPISGHGLNEIVQRRAKLAGLQPLSAHILRHTGITHLLMSGCSIVDVQIMARHSDPKQTMAYAMMLRRLENSPGRTLAQVVQAKRLRF
jgi:integrase